MAQITGTRTTYQTRDTEGALIRDVGPDLVLLEPNEGALITLLNKMEGRRKSTINPKFECLERDYVARWGTNSANEYSNSATSVVVTDGTQFAAGDLVLVPKAASDSTAPEVFLVTAVSTNTLTVTRGFGGNAAIIPASVPLRIIGSAAEEDGAFPTPKSSLSETVYNYTQIIRTPLTISGTQMASATYGGIGTWNDELRLKGKEHKIKMNGAFLLGKRAESMTGGATGNPIRQTAGINSFISTNKFNAGGTLSRKALEEFARMSFRYGSPEKLLLAAPLIVSAISQWAGSHLQTRMEDSSFGMRVTRVITGHGDWLLARDWSLENPSSDGYGFGGWALSLDLENLTYRYLESNGVSRDTKIVTLNPENRAGKDGTSAEYISEVGLQVKLEKTHAKMYNVTDFYE